VENYPFRLFIESMKSAHTRKVYPYSLKEFMRFSKIDDYNKLLKLGEEKIRNLLKSWVLSLKEKGLKASTISGKLNAVFAFYDANDMEFPKKSIRKLIPSSDYIPDGDQPYTTDDIKKMLDSSAKPRTKALIHFLASTGIRPTAIEEPVLRVKDLVDMPLGCKAIQIYKDSRQRYWAFITPEAVNALKNYHGSRRLNGEQLTGDSPVFATTQKNIHGKKNEFLSSKSVRQKISAVTAAAGISRRDENQRIIKAVIYGFRKRFNTTLKTTTGVNANIAEKLMGHSNGLDGAYLKPTREQCFEEFVKVIGPLTVSDEARDKIRIRKLESKNSQVEELRSEFEEMKKKLERQVSQRTAINLFHETGDVQLLRDVSPDLMDALGCWTALKASGKIPSTFKNAKTREWLRNYVPKISARKAKKNFI